MILPVNNFNSQAFTGDNDSDKKYTKDNLLKNNLITRTRIGFDKLSNAFTLYPAKGLKGDKNSNFYEFLTMGAVPYLIGSLTLMSVFNSANKHFNIFDKERANKVGRRMALGVILYGVMKSLSKSFINAPVKWLTGVDGNTPYAKVNYKLPENVNDTDITSIEYHKVFESVDFPYWAMLYGDEAKGKKRNEKYDKIAKKNGLGTDLNDSDQEVKPLVKQIIVRSSMAKSITSYLWAAAGVGFAMQQGWDRALKRVCEKGCFHRDNINETFKIFKDSIKKASKEFWEGPSTSKFGKYSGKLLLLVPIVASCFGVMHSVFGLNKPSKVDASNVIKPEDKYVVN